ncbi:MAG: TetR/AcrR family transcriptional regulator [Deltaproteobacteria bacterium]|nr:TetR/AcrR family transcriptional regulator [Deltaproteobacteria bacterium]
MASRKTRARKNLSRARNEFYLERVVEAAERVFAERSFDAAKIQEIADEAGIALGTLYKVFRGKAEIFRSIHERRSRDLFAACEAALRPDAPPLAQLLDFVTAYLEFLIAHPEYLRMHLGDSSAWGFGGRFETHVQARAWRRGHETEVGLFERGIDEGVFIDRDPSLLVRMMAAIQQVQLAHWIEGGRKATPETLLAEMRVDLVRTFCRPEVARWLAASERNTRRGRHR